MHRSNVNDNITVSVDSIPTFDDKQYPNQKVDSAGKEAYLTVRQFGIEQQKIIRSVNNNAVSEKT